MNIKIEIKKGNISYELTVKRSPERSYTHIKKVNIPDKRAFRSHRGPNQLEEGAYTHTM
jgi:hypothetical protein